MAQTSVVTGERRPAAKRDRLVEARESSPKGWRGRGLVAAGAGAGVEGGGAVEGEVDVGGMAAACGVTAAGDALGCGWFVGGWVSVARKRGSGLLEVVMVE